MELVLTIENETTLPDGGPISVTIQGTRGIDIGRGQYLDWTLPDPSRFISSKHCEIRWHDGAYWLHDVSTNGTFIAGSDGRLKGPHKVRDGDRFSIGHYVIGAVVRGDAPSASDAPGHLQALSNSENLWDAEGDIAPPIDPKQLKAARDLQPVNPDFLDWAIDVPKPERHQSRAPAARIPVSAVSPDSGDIWSEPDLQPPPSPDLPAPAQPKAADTSSRQAPAAAITAVNNADFVRLFARNAGLPEDTFAGRDPSELAAELGLFVRIAAEGMKQLLDARQQAKRVSRTSNQTTIQALDNNPLKFAPTVEDALRVMFGPTMKSYLGAQDAFKQGFDDLKIHQVKTFSAMQKALKRLLDELDPSAIERALTDDRGLAAVIGSRKARLWDAYVSRWHARTKNQQDGQLNAFMALFAEYYDSDGNKI